tara:strand:- start:150 stop:338 length:189 start_codon:yes stop_codon:yes gene_type:complete
MAPVMLVEICVFDDGNQKYKEYKNEWIITEYKRGGDKLKLVNARNKEVVINSISSWKVLKIE